MNRFERKCFIGSAGLHGLLLVAFVAGSAFVSKKFVEIPPVVNMLAIPTDLPINSGGNPNSVQPQPTPAQPAQPQNVQPPQPKPPEPEPPKPVKVPEPKAEQVKKTEVKPKEPVKKETPKDKGEIPVTTTKKPTPKSDISTNLVVRNNVDVVRQQREAAAKAAKARAEQLAWQRETDRRNQIAKEAGNALGNLSKNLSKDTVVDAGPGPGGEAYGNYGGLVSGTYRRAIESQNPQNDDMVNAVIRTTISRDGAVLRAEFLQRTGNSLVDKAVDRALKTVHSVPAFPAGTTDRERTFTITLSFQPKRASA